MKSVEYIDWKDNARVYLRYHKDKHNQYGISGTLKINYEFPDVSKWYVLDDSGRTFILSENSIIEYI
jgi:hypothetical protein